MPADDDDRVNGLSTVRNHGGNCSGLGAGTLGVGGIFDVATHVQLAPVIEQRGADAIIRVLAVCVLPYCECRVDQVLFVQILVPRL